MYECLTSSEARQAILGLCLSNHALYEEITKPPASTTPVPPGAGNGSYLEDDEDNHDNGPIFNSSLSVNDAISQILDLPNCRTPIDVYDLDDDEAESVDGYGCIDCECLDSLDNV